MDELTIDRSRWPSGEWDTEGDRESFVCAGLDCIVLRNRLGAWCGYVGVPRGHALYEKGEDKLDVRVHGGLTWAHESDPPYRYPIDGREEPLWWFGFDCAHLGDDMPALRETHYESSYKNVAYVRNETERLAVQIAALAGA